MEKQVSPNRSKAIQEALEDKLTRLKRTRLAVEYAKLDPKVERAMAEEGMDSESWPNYRRTFSTERFGKKLSKVSPEELAMIIDGLNEIIN